MPNMVVPLKHIHRHAHTHKHMHAGANMCTHIRMHTNAHMIWKVGRGGKNHKVYICI